MDNADGILAFFRLHHLSARTLPARKVKKRSPSPFTRPHLLVIDPEGVVLPAQGEALGFLYAEKETIYDPVAMSLPKTCSMNF